jgi:hypothetical protein
VSDCVRFLGITSDNTFISVLPNIISQRDNPLFFEASSSSHIGDKPSIRRVTNETSEGHFVPNGSMTAQPNGRDAPTLEGRVTAEATEATEDDA